MTSFKYAVNNKFRVSEQTVIPVSLEKPPEDTHSHDPHGLLGGSGILGTLPLSKASVPALPTRFVVLAHARPGVDSDRLLDDETILDQLADVLARVGVGNLVNLVGIQPNLEMHIRLVQFTASAIAKHTLFLPHFMTPAARRFCSLRELIVAIKDLSETLKIENHAKWGSTSKCINVPEKVSGQTIQLADPRYLFLVLLGRRNLGALLLWQRFL